MKQVDTILVVKVGTSTLTKRNKNGRLELDTEAFYRIGKQVVDLQHSGYHVAIVSSAAITAGMAVTGVLHRPTNIEASMPTLQGLASVGWRHVVNGWADALQPYTVGELLITKQELERTSERSEFLRVVHGLMINGYIPIINENDAIAHEEIAFGDNDTLAASFAAKLKSSDAFGNAVSLVLLSSIDGVYKDTTDSSTLIREISHLSEYEQYAKIDTSDGGTGGMVTKFAAAKVAQNNQIDMYIANGRTASIRQVLAKQKGTYFKPPLSLL